MATAIKRIEKEFLLKVLADEQLPLMCFYNRLHYTLVVQKVGKETFELKANTPIQGLKTGIKLNFVFDYRGQVISFSARVITYKEEFLTVENPEFFYKNLSRSYSRVQAPRDLVIQFTFHGDRYNLDYPKVQEYEIEEINTLVEHFDPKNIKGIIQQLASWAAETTSGYKLVIFKDTKPTSREEKLLAETGKALFLPSTYTGIPKTDPYPKPRIITEDIFVHYLLRSGVDKIYVDDAIARFIKSKQDDSIFSDLWVPILFQEYVIGYIHLWIDMEGKPPFDFSTLDTAYQFAKVLAFSLKENGYFEQGKVKKTSFQGRIMDISASGMLFAYPLSPLSSALLPDSELDVELITPRRTIKTIAKIVRRYTDASTGYFGCRFQDIAPEDMRFLFEYIYGKPFTDQDAQFLSGNV
ncbi:MAG: PilZ domain-containing protein [Breznakiellaceae bacterium]